jgi:hypothetical protein
MQFDSFAGLIGEYGAAAWKFVLGLSGSMVSLKFMRGTSTWEKLTMVFGGAMLSYLGSAKVAGWVGMLDALGFVGFLLGLFGMAIVVRIWEGIQSVDLRGAMQRVVDGISGIFGKKD